MLVPLATKPLLYRLLCWCVALACSAAPRAYAAEIDYAVMVSATAEPNPPQITLTWPAHASATEYRISRKLSSATSFTALATITTGAGSLTSYVDNTVSAGTGYEYEVRRLRSGETVYGYGYIASAINLPMVEDRGKLILLVDNTMATQLAAELTRLEADLRGDGWTVVRHDVSRTATVTSVKALITTAFAADPAAVKAVFLFGRIPVPYSGDIAPDGHTPDHKGAWPADCFYGDMDGNWTDTTVNNTASSKYGTRNHNVPGDGKFDQSSMPGLGNSRIELMLGRVDLSSLPAYSTLTEAQLLRRYLNKDHAWRHGTLVVNRRGLVDENFDLTEKAGTGGFRMFGALFGAGSTSAADYTGALASNGYLASYGDGAGDTSSCSGVVATANFASNDYRTVFTFLFGSYFGDWDSSNNLLRAALASPTYTLASTWGSRPYPVYHTLGMGDPIGAGVRLTQNFSGNEGVDIYKPSHTSRFSFDDNIHVALMGDPTLRLHPVKPVTGLQVGASEAQNTLTWTASADTNIVGYHVYRASSPAEPLIRLTGTPVTASDPSGSPISDTSYTDPIPPEGGGYRYMVRAVKLESSNTGTYYNLSQGTFVTNAPPVIAANQAHSSLVNTTFTYLLKAYENPSSYAHVGGALPPGISLDTTNGLLSGTPTAAGTYTPSFTATNANGTSSAVAVTLTINLPPAPVVAPNQAVSGYVESGFRYQVVASGNPTSYALASGSLPPGVALNTTTGVLSGTLTSAGTFTPAITATNGTGTSEPVAMTLTVHPVLGLIIYEPFNYSLGANSPDPGAGANGGNGLPATNVGGSPSGTSTGLRSVWGNSTDVVTGLSYAQGAKTLVTSGNAGRVNNATWGTGTPGVYRSMTTDPFIADRIGSGGNLGADGTSLYVSFLGSTSSTATEAFNLSLRYDGSNNFFISNTATGWRLNGTAASNAPLALNTPTFFVVRFDFAPGATDTVSLWINPVLGQPLGTPNAVATGINFPGLNNFQTRSSASNAMTLDELRVGTSLAAVTPFIPTPPIPAAPSDLRALAPSASQIDLNWNDNASDETSFELERSLDGSTGWTQIATPAANVTNFSDSGLTAGTTYHYRIRAANAAGKSEYSSTLNATTLNGVQDFRAANGLAIDGSEDLLIPAADGVNNLLKYAFNMIGSGIGQAPSLSVPNSAVLTARSSAGLPLVGSGTDADAGKLQITFIRRKAGSNPGITYMVEFSDELTSWAPNGSATETVTSINADFERVTVTDSLPSTDKRFARVTVR